MVMVLITQNGFFHVKLKPHSCARAKAGREVHGAEGDQNLFLLPTAETCGHHWENTS